MNKRKFEKEIESGRYIEVGRFKNSYGEEFVIYRYPSIDNNMITGDEFDWKHGYEVLRPSSDTIMVAQRFILNQEERQKIVELLDE
jgi:hypothetical protein